MTETMRGDKKESKWTHGIDKHFEILRQKVAKLPIFSLPNFNKVFQFESNVSSNAIGAVLSEEGKLVAFFSEKLNDAKKYFVY